MLHYLRHAWTLDDISEVNGIYIDTNNEFLMCFIVCGSTKLYQKWIIEPTRNNSFCDQEAVFGQAGFNGTQIQILNV